MELMTQMRSNSKHPFALMCFEPSAYSQSDHGSSPKKQHLTQQFLIEVTRKEGLGWEADLVAHVSEVLFTFYYLSLLPITSNVQEKATR